MNSIVFNYFRDNYGYKNKISEEEIALKERYKHFSKKDLKKELKTLKLNNASINIIKYVAKEIRSRINKKPISITVATANDDEISKNFWGYAKKVFRSGSSFLPSFDVVQTTTYFFNVLKCVNRMKVFSIASWIPKLKEPNIPFNLSPPIYHEITRIIKRMKSHHKSFKKATTECNHYLNRPKNVFGEVHHSIVQSVLRYHYIPDEINRIVKILYNDFHLSIITNDFHTTYIAVEKVVLQGDSFSPLIFNLIINTFKQCVKEEKFTNFGYRSFKGFLPRNWFQFADDAVAVTSLEGENQILLNLFSKWLAGQK